MTISDETDRPFLALAFERAVANVAERYPDAPSQKRVLDAVMAAVLDLSNAGQTDVEQLARYAANKGAAAFRGN